MQLNLPVSTVLSDKFVAHSNAGMTYTPSAKNPLGAKASLKAFNLGQSPIWLAHQRFNVMFEAVWTRAESVRGPGLKSRSDAVFLNPGVRWSHDFESGLQIVPGISIPIGVGPTRGDVGILFYLSFEHPLKKH